MGLGRRRRVSGSDSAPIWLPRSQLTGPRDGRPLRTRRDVPKGADGAGGHGPCEVWRKLAGRVGSRSSARRRRLYAWRDRSATKRSRVASSCIATPRAVIVGARSGSQSALTGWPSSGVGVDGWPLFRNSQVGEFLVAPSSGRTAACWHVRSRIWRLCVCGHLQVQGQPDVLVPASAREGHRSPPAQPSGGRRYRTCRTGPSSRSPRSSPGSEGAVCGAWTWGGPRPAELSALPQLPLTVGERETAVDLLRI